MRFVPRVRFSLRGLLAAVAFVAVACAGLRYANVWWASSLFTLTLVVLIVAILGVACSKGPRRMAWLGCALFGWTYFLLVFGPWSSEHLAPRLVTTQGLVYLGSKLQPNQYAWVDVGFNTAGSRLVLSGNPTTIWDSGTGGRININTSNAPVYSTWVDVVNGTTLGSQQPATPFQQVGQSLWTLLAAALGALLAAWFARPREEAGKGEVPMQPN
jgi:hypothetical protein